jgi:hypothetical protein
MSKETGEQVIKREVYKVGMTVRDGHGKKFTIMKDTGEDDDCCPIQSDKTSWMRCGQWCAEPTNRDIIGEVVANATAPKVATKAKVVPFAVSECRAYVDGMVVIDGKADRMAMAELVDKRRYYDRAISRLKATAKHYGWEVV